jgi:hypothetical protein
LPGSSRQEGASAAAGDPEATIAGWRSVIGDNPRIEEPGSMSSEIPT